MGRGGSKAGKTNQKGRIKFKHQKGVHGRMKSGLARMVGDRKEQKK